MRGLWSDTYVRISTSVTSSTTSGSTPSKFWMEMNLLSAISAILCTFLLRFLVLVRIVDRLSGPGSATYRVDRLQVHMKACPNNPNPENQTIVLGDSDNDNDDEDEEQQEQQEEQEEEETSDVEDTTAIPSMLEIPAPTTPLSTIFPSLIHSPQSEISTPPLDHTTLFGNSTTPRSTTLANSVQPVSIDLTTPDGRASPLASKQVIAKPKQLEKRMNDLKPSGKKSRKFKSKVREESERIRAIDALFDSLEPGMKRPAYVPSLIAALHEKAERKQIDNLKREGSKKTRVASRKRKSTAVVESEETEDVVEVIASVQSGSKKTTRVAAVTGEHHQEEEAKTFGEMQKSGVARRKRKSALREETERIKAIDELISSLKPGVKKPAYVPPILAALHREAELKLQGKGKATQQDSDHSTSADESSTAVGADDETDFVQRQTGRKGRKEGRFHPYTKNPEAAATSIPSPQSHMPHLASDILPQPQQTFQTPLPPTTESIEQYLPLLQTPQLEGMYGGPIGLPHVSEPQSFSNSPHRYAPQHTQQFFPDIGTAQQLQTNYPLATHYAFINYLTQLRAQQIQQSNYAAAVAAAAATAMNSANTYAVPQGFEGFPSDTMGTAQQFNFVQGPSTTALPNPMPSGQLQLPAEYLAGLYNPTLNDSQNIFNANLSGTFF